MVLGKFVMFKSVCKTENALLAIISQRQYSSRFLFCVPVNQKEMVGIPILY